MFLTARLFMYEHVYFHRTVRAIDLDMAEVFAPSIRAIFGEGSPAERLADYADLDEYALLHQAARWARGESLSETPAIFTAWREFRIFMVKASDYKLLRVPLADLPQLAQAAPEVIDHFELAEKGESIYWPGLNLRLTWDDLAQLVEPQARLRVEQRDPDFVVRYGQAIEALRERAGIPREAIPGLGARTVRRIERGETRTSANAIHKLAAAHQLSEEEYIARVAELMARPAKG
jgi:hypothetical protein